MLILMYSVADWCTCIKPCRERQQQEPMEMDSAENQETGTIGYEYITPGGYVDAQSASDPYASISGTSGHYDRLDPVRQPVFYDEIGPPQYYNVNNSATVANTNRTNTADQYASLDQNTRDDRRPPIYQPIISPP